MNDKPICPSMVAVTTGMEAPADQAVFGCQLDTGHLRLHEHVFAGRSHHRRPKLSWNDTDALEPVVALGAVEVR